MFFYPLSSSRMSKNYFSSGSPISDGPLYQRLHCNANITHMHSKPLCSYILTKLRTYFSVRGKPLKSLTQPQSSPVATAFPLWLTWAVFTSALSAFLGQIPTTSQPSTLQKNRLKLSQKSTVNFGVIQLITQRWGFVSNGSVLTETLITKTIPRKWL